MQALPTVRARAGRLAYRPFRVAVRRIEQLTPAFVRVTFTGADLAEFGTEGLDQRIKLLFPVGGPRGVMPDLGIDEPDGAGASQWYPRWRALPCAERPAMRTYTVRQARPEMAELDVVLVRHEGCTGAAGEWLRAAAPGDEIVVIGPDAASTERGAGIDWRPGRSSTLLLAGDETAAPAVLAILEATVDRSVTAFIEVPTRDDVLPTWIGAQTRVHWLPRNGLPHGTLLLPAVTSWLDGHAGVLDASAAGAGQPLDDIDVDSELLWDSPAAPTADFYSWIAGEAAVVKQLRRALVTDRLVDRRQVAFLGYWRQGQAERQ